MSAYQGIYSKEQGILCPLFTYPSDTARLRLRMIGLNR